MIKRKHGFCVRFSAEELNALRGAAQEVDRSMGAYIRLALRQHIADPGEDIQEKAPKGIDHYYSSTAFGGR